MVSEGDEIDVKDWGICKLNEDSDIVVYLVEEDDGSINWYLNYDDRRDNVLTSRHVDFVRNR